MRRKRRTLWWLGLLAVLLLWDHPLRAGTVIEQEITDLWGKRTGSILSYADKRLRIDQKDGVLSTIMDFKKDRIIILDHPSKSYVRYPFSFWQEQVSQGIGKRRRHMKRQIQVKPTGSEMEINGFHTIQLHVTIDETVLQDTWVTQDVDLDPMLENVREGAGRPSGLSESEAEANEEIYRKIKKWGFPILTIEYRQYAGKMIKEVTEVKRIESRKLSNALFAIPEEYTPRHR